MGNLTPIARGLLILNIAVLIIDQFVNPGFLTEYGALYYFESPSFRPWQLLTHMFLHGGVMHLLGNMMGLFFFGPWLERTWGARNFFIFYFACGFGGATLELGGLYVKNQTAISKVAPYSKKPTVHSLEAYQKEHEPEIYKRNKDFFEGAKYALSAAAKIEQGKLEGIDEATKEKVLKQSRHYKREVKKAFTEIEEAASSANFKMVGASGAIFGILLAFALFFPNVEMMLLFFPVPVKAKYFVLIYMVFTIYAASGGNVGLDNVAHLAHLGGAIVGFFLARFWLWRFKH